MKTKSIMVLGTAGVVLLLVAKYELLQDLPLKAGTYLLAVTAPGWVQVFLNFYLPSAAPKTGLRELAGASFFLFLIVVWLQWAGLFAFLALFVFCGALLLIFRARPPAGGAWIGAAGEWTELFIYLFVTAAVRQ